MDINFCHDYNGNVFMILNLVCVGTGYQMELYIREGKGVPRLSVCVDLVLTHWVNWAGYPKSIISDFVLKNRGVFIREINAANVSCSSIGLEAPNQIAKVERHGSMWKHVRETVVQGRQITEPRKMKIMAAETTAVTIMQNRYGGFRLCVWLSEDRHDTQENNETMKPFTLSTL